MTPLNASSIFMSDPWWLSLIKVVLIFLIQLLWCLFNVWFMRRVLGKMQNRKGPIMNSPGGLLQAIGDGLKLLFKETFIPAGTDKLVYAAAPVIAGVCAFTTWAVIPLGGQVHMFGHLTRLQVTDLPVAVLFMLAISSIGIYGLVLAGWSSDNAYSLLGGLRASAQMISYEVAMGLSLVPVFIMAGSMSTSKIVEAQTQHLTLFGVSTPLPFRFWLLLPSLCIYFIAMLGESNTPPFDLAECEQELVAGYSTEYTGFQYGTYYLAEFINMATLSAIAVTLFFGGYSAPWPFNGSGAENGWWGLLWFFLKTQIMIFVLIWVRGSLPRYRYDQFMHIGWKGLIPISLVWVLAVTVLKTAANRAWFGNWVFWIAMAAVCLALLAALMFTGREEPAPTTSESETFDAFAGGYPVPPLPGQVLPGRSRLVRAEPVDATISNGADL